MKPTRQEHIIYIVSKSEAVTLKCLNRQLKCVSTLSAAMMMVMQSRRLIDQIVVYIFIEEGEYEENGLFEECYYSQFSTSYPLTIHILPVSSSLLNSTLEIEDASTTQDMVSTLSTMDEELCDNIVDVKVSSTKFMTVNTIPTFVLKLTLRIHVRHINISGRDLTNMFLLSDACFIFEKCKFDHMYIHVLNNAQLLLSGNKAVNTMIRTIQNTKLIAVNNQFLMTKKFHEFMICIRDQSTVDIDDNQFDLDGTEFMTAVRIDISFQPGFGCHVHIQNNTFSKCHCAVSCLPDLQSTTNQGTGSALSHHSIHIKNNSIHNFKKCAVEVSVLHLKAQIQYNVVDHPVLNEQNPQEQQTGIWLCDGSSCIVTHNEIVGTAYNNDEYTSDILDNFNFHGIIIHGVDTKPEILFNKISNCNSGIYCTGYCMPDISDNELYENTMNIQVTDHAIAHIHDNIIKDSLSCGVAVYRGGLARIISNIFNGTGQNFENIYLEGLGSSAIVLDNEIKQGRNGIKIAKLACAFIRRNKISHMGCEGIYVTDCGLAYIYDNVITMCVNSGIDVAETQTLQANADDPRVCDQILRGKAKAVDYTYYDERLNPSHLKRCHIENNQIYGNTLGVLVDSCGATLLNNSIFNNTECNVLIQFDQLFLNLPSLLQLEYFHVVLNGNRIYESMKLGIGINMPTDINVNILIEENNIYDCHDCGMLICGDKNLPSLIVRPSILVNKNIICGSQEGANIRVCDNATCRITNNKIFDCVTRHGVQIRNGAYCILKDNEIYGNYKCGITIFNESSAAELEGNLIYENGINVKIDNSAIIRSSDSIIIDPAMQPSKGIVLANNKIICAKTDNVMVKFRLPPSKQKKLVRANLIIFDNQIHKAARFGIIIIDYSDHIHIQKNNIHLNESSGLFVGQGQRSSIIIEDNSIVGSAIMFQNLSTLDGLFIRNNSILMAPEAYDKPRWLGNMAHRLPRMLDKQNNVSNKR
jgi:parallel beta-helix repeat protein